MDFTRFSEPVRRVLTLGADLLNDYPDWYDYRSLGIEAEHAPELLDASRRIAEFDVRPDGAAFDEPAAPDGSPIVPEHAWRALAQLRLPETAAPLAELLPLLTQGTGDYFIGDMPHVFASIGPASIPHLAKVLLSSEEDSIARSIASAALLAISARFEQAQEEALAPVRTVLEDRENVDEELNGFIVDNLLNAGIPDVLDLITKAYADQVVGEEIIRWEDVMEQLGLSLPHPNPRPMPTPKRPRSFSDFGFSSGSGQQSAARAKAKAKKKKIKAQRKQTRRKKK